MTMELVPDYALPVPLVDLGWQSRQISGQVELGFAEVLADSTFVLGPQVTQFERAFAEACGVDHCVGVANGTDAVELALRACGVRAGDEVVLPTNSFVATAGAVVRMGAVPVLVDCDPTFLLIDVEQVVASTGPRTVGLLPVHLYGQQADMLALRAHADRTGLALVEDAAQAQGARRHGRGLGALSDAAATSFYPGKNLGAYGDAGAVLTSSADVDGRLRLLRNHGSTDKYQHVTKAVNSRMDSLQAVVLLAKLRHLDHWNALRVAAAARYDELLADLPVGRPSTTQGNDHVWHLYTIRVPRRDEVIGALHTYGIRAGIHYPVPIHLQPAFADLGYRRGAFPVAERVAGELISLPIYPGITASQQKRVIAGLAQALGRTWQ